MIPSTQNLKTLVGKKIQMDIQLTSQPDILSGAMVKNYGVSLENLNDKVLLKRIDSTTGGIWVPYAEGKAVVGYLGCKRWISSGPFSGCQFAVGKDKKKNRVFAAHIAKQSGSTGEVDYKKYRRNNELSEWYWNKIPMPNLARYSCSYVFVICNKDRIISMNRMDVDVTTMGGSDGEITHIHTFK